jgi:hypothetical protein
MPVSLSVFSYCRRNKDKHISWPPRSPLALPIARGWMKSLTITCLSNQTAQLQHTSHICLLVCTASRQVGYRTPLTLSWRGPRHRPRTLCPTPNLAVSDSVVFAFVLLLAYRTGFDSKLRPAPALGTFNRWYGGRDVIIPWIINLGTSGHRPFLVHNSLSPSPNILWNPGVLLSHSHQHRGYEHNAKLVWTRSVFLWGRYVNATATVLDIIHRPVFYLKHTGHNIRTSQEAPYVSTTSPSI